VTNCPSPECREELKQEMVEKCNSIKSYISDGIREINEEMNERPKTKTLLIIISIFATLGIASVGWIYSGYSNTQKSQNSQLHDRVEIDNDCQERVNQLGTQFELMKKDIIRMDDNISKLDDKMDTSQDIQLEMLRLLQRMNSSGNNL